MRPAGSPRRRPPAIPPASGPSVSTGPGPAARATLVVFLDDDVLPRPGCFAALEAAHADRRVHAAGGRIVLRFEGVPPSWLTTPFVSYLAGYDLGDWPRDVTG